MKALVVYESMFGNTRDIAVALASGLSGHCEVSAVEVGDAPRHLPDDVDMVVVGGPTHAFSMSRPNTRQSATDQAAEGVISAKIGIREWIEGLSPVNRPVASTTFDTRIDKPRVPGSAAAAAARRLRRLGFHPVAPPQSFFVDGTTGPLLDGEAERARSWGLDLGAEVAGSHQALGPSAQPSGSR